MAERDERLVEFFAVSVEPALGSIGVWVAPHRLEMVDCVRRNRAHRLVAQSHARQQKRCSSLAARARSRPVHTHSFLEVFILELRVGHPETTVLSSPETSRLLRLTKSLTAWVVQASSLSVVEAPPARATQHKHIALEPRSLSKGHVSPPTLMQASR
jgi:hypothetical protein